ncbi:hypothetical protein GCM10009804_00960 [Kribbella hippodromi]|uniref:Uncharacterized protein n=1 Tax=Kribbella hippodromi TaxID=434347 RepID=A0ABN2BVP2_9ACTN
MRLYHRTDEAGKAGIEFEGFAVTATDKQSVGHSWFAGTKESPTARGAGWWVIVELPDDVAESHRHDQFSYRLPFDLVNQYAPFTYEAFEPS